MSAVIGFAAHPGRTLLPAQRDFLALVFLRGFRSSSLSTMCLRAFLALVVFLPSVSFCVVLRGLSAWSSFCVVGWLVVFLRGLSFFRLR